MEYPTFITGSTNRYLNYWPFDQVLLPELTLFHEYGHQYWYGLVGSNEFEEAWLDEGVNSYASGRIVDRALWRRPIAGDDLRIPRRRARAGRGP